MIKNDSKICDIPHWVCQFQSRAEPPKSVVKYVNKLTVNGGKIVAIGVTIKRAISKVLMHWLVSVYNICECEHFSPRKLHKHNNG